MQFVWYDYETWGKYPSYDRPMQFAAIRTDSDLNQIGKEINLHCRPREDCVISPEAVAVTGKSPFHDDVKAGLSEAEFADRIHREFTRQPFTCVVGYNAMSFDHEVTRQLFYRNLRDPYKWHWAEGNARWDLIFLVSAARLLNRGALRKWPQKDDGSPSFRQGDFVDANVDEPESEAHDALNDVRDMLKLARILKRNSPNLFDHAIKMVRKEHVLEECGDCFLYVSPFIREKGRYATIMVRIGPDMQGTWFWSYDLSKDPTPLQKPFKSWSEEDHKNARKWTRRIKANEAPFVRHCPLPAESERAVATFNAMKLTSAQVEANLQQLRSNIQPIRDYCASLEARWEESDGQEVDADEALYSGGFWTWKQRAQINEVIEVGGDASRWQRDFDDARLETLVFRYRARNYPEALTLAEQERWRTYCRSRQMKVRGKSSWLERWNKQLRALKENPAKAFLVPDLEAWHAQVTADLELI